MARAGLLGAAAIAGQEVDPGAAPGQLHRGRLADPGRGAGNEDGLPRRGRAGPRRCTRAAARDRTVRPIRENPGTTVASSAASAAAAAAAAAAVRSPARPVRRALSPARPDRARSCGPGGAAGGTAPPGPPGAGHPTGPGPGRGGPRWPPPGSRAPAADQAAAAGRAAGPRPA